MSTTQSRRRWFQFNLRSLFVLVTIAAFIAWKAPSVVRYFFPPKPEDEFDQLIDLITTTIKTDSSLKDTDTETLNTKLILEGGQVVDEQPNAPKTNSQLGGGVF